MGNFADTGVAYIQCQAANTGARAIALQPYSGSVGVGTTDPDSYAALAVKNS